MIQAGTFLKVIDNSGAKVVCCIKVLTGYRRRYAFVGDIVLVSVKSIRAKRRLSVKAAKGKIFRALVVRTKSPTKTIFGDNLSFLENSVVLLTNQNKLFSTRIFGSLPKKFRYTKYARLLSVSTGLV